jgi:hypothetical protein
VIRFSTTKAISELERKREKEEERLRREREVHIYHSASPKT